DRIERELGPIGALANVAGVLRVAPALELTAADWAACFAVNVTGVVNVSRAVARRMIPRRDGAIVTVASNAARTPRVGMAACAASRAAAVMFPRCLGLELAAHGIRCNTVSPGSTDTPMQRALWRGDGDARRVIEGDLASHRLGIPTGRIASPEEVAAL